MQPAIWIKSMAEVLTAFIKAPRITQVLTIVLCLILLALLVTPHLF
ncbi:hypothetical protein CSC04_4980 [Enterobacter roggenkampii]|nr:hypothetical protein CSC04_4980 [Enterobacter roggenkampii]